jgi:hypothetical protein
MVMKVNNGVLISVGRTRSKVMIAWDAITHAAMGRYGRLQRKKMKMATYVTLRRATKLVYLHGVAS